jgi:transcriptional regulator with XRE-family HTH domain
MRVMKIVSRPEVQIRIGKKIAMLRLQRGVTQEDLANSCGIHRSHMGQLERGELNVTLATLLTVAAALHISISELFAGIA